MKKQDTSSLRSSSYRQENSPKTLQAKSIGCMSGIFHLIYKYNHRRGKFITSGKKQEKNIIISSVSPSSKQQQESNIVVIGGNDNINNSTRLTCDVPRSPTLPAEIRRGNNVKTAEMGFLQEASEKRRKLIEAVEKCDDDLKELKKIIDAVKSSITVDDRDDNYKMDGDLQPSPVSVLDGFTPLSSATLSGGGGNPRRNENGGAEEQQKKQKQKKKPGEDDNIIIMNMNNNTMGSETRKVEGKRSENATAAVISRRPMWGSKAMIDSVNEVCRDIAWGERREIGRIGLALQDYICRDLIDEFVQEIGISFCFYSLPFDACRRRLRF